MSYRRYVCFSSLDFQIAHSGTHRSGVIVSVKAEMKPRAVAEADDTDTSQRWTDGKRVDQLHNEIEHGHIPVVKTSPRRVDYARSMIQDDADIRVFGTDYASTITNTHYVQKR